MRSLVAVLLLLSLAGCLEGQSPLHRFESKAALFADSRGECPFTEEVVLAEWLPDATTGKAAWGESIVYTPVGRICITRPASSSGVDGVQRLFVSIGPNLWIVQSQREEARPTYAIARRTADLLEFYHPVCTDFPPQTLVGAGVSFIPEKAIEAAAAAVVDKPSAQKPPMSTSPRRRAQPRSRPRRSQRANRTSQGAPRRALTVSNGSSPAGGLKDTR